MALYNQYRPTNFGDLFGQEYVKRILSHQVKENKLSNAYLLTGPAGTGKTTVARIFSSMINCSSGMTLTPDQNDPNVQMIMSGKSDIDVIEIDAASRRGIDDIKDVRDRSYYAPVSMRKKIWIIDECHQLTGPAWEALLKLLEEPPTQSMFILCTTEPHKISETILTRCMALRFTAINAQEIYTYLKVIIQKEQIDIEEEAVRLLAKSSKGSPRQAVSNLEKVMNLGCKIDAALVSQTVGVPSTKLIKDFLISVVDAKFEDGLKASSQAIAAGVTAADFIEEIATYFHHLMVIKLKCLPSYNLTQEEINEIEQVRTAFVDRMEKLQQGSASNAIPIILVMIKAISGIKSYSIYNMNHQYTLDFVWMILIKALRKGTST